ncbi:MAG TPA: hypothetical protein VKH42_05485 [Vicinamibacterales bacterium]|nr:hypothetical protein [Vicinamibacterales bacterium]
MFAARRAALAAAGLIALASAGVACGPPPRDPIVLESNRITVENNTGKSWLGVEVWINKQYRITTPLISAGEKFQSPLDAFVEGFGHRFDFKREQITDVRLKAKLPSNQPIEIVKDFDDGALAALGRAFKSKK